MCFVSTLKKKTYFSKLIKRGKNMFGIKKINIYHLKLHLKVNKIYKKTLMF